MHAIDPSQGFIGHGGLGKWPYALWLTLDKSYHPLIFITPQLKGLNPTIHHEWHGKCQCCYHQRKGNRLCDIAVSKLKQTADSTLNISDWSKFYLSRFNPNQNVNILTGVSGSYEHWPCLESNIHQIFESLVRLGWWNIYCDKITKSTVEQVILFSWMG
jgi:hypothetical protein